MDNFKIDKFISIIEESLEKYLNDFYYNDSDVLKASAYSLLNGGKRTRAILSFLVGEMLEIDIEKIKPIAAAIEMVHCYSLIHDDLPCMDNDDLRRGKPSCHIAFNESTALLAGDSLISVAGEVILNNKYLSEKEKVNVLNLFYKAIGPKGMIYGQELDLKYENTIIDKDSLNKIHVNKTGRLILFVQQGVSSLKEITNEEKEILDLFFLNIGLVFQIVDDILDVTTSSELLGKPTGSDLENQKSTFVSLYGLEKAQKIAQDLTDDAINKLKEKFLDKSHDLIEYTNFLLSRKK